MAESIRHEVEMLEEENNRKRARLAEVLRKIEIVQKIGEGRLA